MEITEEQLTGYVDGALDEQQRADVERALAADPALAARVHRHRALQERLRSAYDSVLEEVIPARLLAASRMPEINVARVSSAVADLAARRATRTATPAASIWRPAGWLAAAASVLLGIALGWWLPHGDGGQLVQVRGSTAVAQGILAAALSTQRAERQTGGEPVQIGISYRDRQGHYCRTFATAGAQALAGLACRSQQQTWLVQLLATANQRGGGEYRTAATNMPPEILDRVQADISGAALDSVQEAAAVRSHWQ